PEARREAVRAPRGGARRADRLRRRVGGAAAPAGPRDALGPGRAHGRRREPVRRARGRRRLLHGGEQGALPHQRGRRGARRPEDQLAALEARADRERGAGEVSLAGRIGNLSIGAKLTGASLLASGVALLLVCIGIFAYERSTF